MAAVNVNKSGYDLRDCALFRVTTKKKIAKILRISRSNLQQRCRSEDQYREQYQPKKNGKLRHIEAPPFALKQVQRRVHDLLQRVDPPDFLFCPAKGRSHVENAAAHRGARVIHTLDIKDYFPSTTSKRVYWFFHTVMECSTDVAGILTKITTRNGYLPQGSPASSILAYYANMEMWGKVAALAEQFQCRLTVYVDDVTISGERVPGDLLYAVRRVIELYGFENCKEKERHKVDAPAKITGFVVRGNQLLRPNNQHKRMKELRDGIVVERNSEARAKLHKSLSGLEAQKFLLTRLEDGKGV